MNSLELIKKVSSSNLSQQETVTIFQDIFLGKVSDQKIEDFLINIVPVYKALKFFFIYISTLI